MRSSVSGAQVGGRSFRISGRKFGYQKEINLAYANANFGNQTYNIGRKERMQLANCALIHRLPGYFIPGPSVFGTGSVSQETTIDMMLAISNQEGFKRHRITKYGRLRAVMRLRTLCAQDVSPHFRYEAVELTE